MSHLTHSARGTRASFSLLRRHRAGRELSAYVVAQLESGRSLFEALDDAWVRERVAGRPYLLEDLADDRLVLEAIESRAGRELEPAPAGPAPPARAERRWRLDFVPLG